MFWGKNDCGGSNLEMLHVFIKSVIEISFRFKRGRPGRSFKASNIL